MRFPLFLGVVAVFLATSSFGQELTRIDDFLRSGYTIISIIPSQVSEFSADALREVYLSNGNALAVCLVLFYGAPDPQMIIAQGHCYKVE